MILQMKQQKIDGILLKLRSLEPPTRTIKDERKEKRMEPIKYYLNQKPARLDAPIEAYGLENAKKVRAWHRSLPAYRETPLRCLNHLAEQLGISSLLVKDESARFGLNSFKALGGSYAIGRALAERLDRNLSDLPFPVLLGDSVRGTLGAMTFVTATDGNHGRGVAWTADCLGQKSVVYMPRGSAPERLKNIQALGAEASITDLSYDDAVRFAAEQAEKNAWVLVQDTSWEAYEKIPGWIMEGYTTMGAEMIEQLGDTRPTHVFLQAGVGAMAGAMTAFFSDAYRTERPKIIIVEPQKADCLFRTTSAGDGTLHAVTDDMDTIMAGLACGEPCGIAWPVLRQYADAFLSIPDELAARGMRILGNPLGTDPRIVSGESGAAALGAVTELLQNRSYEPLRAALGLDKNAKLLCISTEGDTDRENYRRIVWDGRYCSE